MKRFFAPFLALLLMASGFIVWRLMRPIAPEPLRTPTSEQLSKAFPKNTRTILENSEQFYFYSLDPSWLSQSKDKFDKWGVLGRTLIRDEATQKQIIAIYYDGIAATNYFSAACFSPRHGIRAVKGKSTLDIVLCFECGNAEVFFNGQKSGHKFGSRRQPIYDKILTERDVPLPQKK